jgi:hypothetical protein
MSWGVASAQKLPQPPDDALSPSASRRSPLRSSGMSLGEASAQLETQEHGRDWHMLCLPVQLSLSAASSYWQNPSPACHQEPQQIWLCRAQSSGFSLILRQQGREEAVDNTAWGSSHQGSAVPPSASGSQPDEVVGHHLSLASGLTLSHCAGSRAHHDHLPASMSESNSISSSSMNRQTINQTVCEPHGTKGSDTIGGVCSW